MNKAYLAIRFLRNKIGFCIYVLGWLIICLGILIGTGIDGLKQFPEVLESCGNKFWQGRN